METREIADQISEVADEHELSRAELEAREARREAEHAAQLRREHFRQRTAVLIGVLAMLLAVTGISGGNATEDIISKNIEASDTWNFYQAKNIRQTEYRISAEVLESLLAGGVINEAARPRVEQQIAGYRATVDRYENEPQEGKTDLFAKATALEHERDRARRQDANFDVAEALFQIAIVLGSVSILIVARPVLLLSIATGLVALFFMLNGFLLFMHLPWA